MGRVPRLVGTDGIAKMSKSQGNTINFKDSAKTAARKIRAMYAGPPRGAEVPGTVAENPVLLYLDTFDHDTAHIINLKERYERRGVSNKELKDRLTTVLNELLEPMREQRAKYERNMSLVRDALKHGTQRGRAAARETIEMVRGALDLNYLMMLCPTLDDVGRSPRAFPANGRFQRATSILTRDCSMGMSCSSSHAWRLNHG